MKYLSLFSGIEAATVAWEPLGWEPVAFCEIDEFPSAVLAHRFPNTPNLGDITKVDWSGYSGAVDVVVGGSPCQSFSIAGKREGLSGESGLMFEYIRAVREIRPRWFVWENVPGALTSEGGEAFRQLLSEMDALGYGLAWRILDAQFFGVAQRRERVFLVGCLGDPERAAEALFEPEGLRWNPTSSRDKRKELAARAERGVGGGSWDAAYTMKIRCGCEGGGKGPLIQEDMSATLATGNDQTLFQPAVAFAANQRGEVRLQGGDGDVFGALPTAWSGKQVQAVVQPKTCVIDRAAYNQGINAKYDPHIEETDVMDTLVARGPHAVGVRGGAATVYEVRRLTPRECERLQGFPDDWTRIPWKGKPAEECPDGPRHKALGNSMAVPVMRWIGKRIQESHSEAKKVSLCI